ncbi:6-phospho-beta-glucosidase, partial [Klebsiella pneumoniae]|uniref:family 4 glycosyl hydrolase n=1 Tax=Klebsiella pneumoniae TaxID=573 RepID=UPI003EE029AA
MSGLKIVVIGGGSSYTPELIEGLLNRYHEMPVASLWLVDIEEGKEKVEIIAGLARRMIAKAGLTIEVVATLDRESALRDADFVCSQFRAGCLDARISDERISLKYGLIGQETNGLGGFANACRTIPIALEIAADMERLCPDAWLLSFTNPSGMVTEAILRHSRIKAVGLCNVPVIMQKGITTLLQCADEKEVVMQVAGLNHFIFVRQILHKGKEWLPEVIAEINAGRDPLVPRNIPPFRWPSHLLQGLGMIPCAYLRYYYMKDDLLRQELAEAGGEGTRGEVVKQLEKILFDQYRDPHLAVKPKALEGRGGQYYSEAACELMNAIYNDKRI